MLQRIQILIKGKTFIISLMLIAAIAVSLKSYFAPFKTFGSDIHVYTNFNNYLIFKQSFYHLINGQDLYCLYPNEQWDLFKYSPAFSLFFSGFAILPDWLGLSLWNILNAMVLVGGVYLLPRFTLLQKGIVLLLVFVELITSMQNSQSNALMAGLLIMCFALLEKKQYFWATFCIVCSVYIKIFGLVGFLLFLFYPNKLKQIAYVLFWVLFFTFIPLFVIDYKQLTFLYTSWAHMLSHDFSNSIGFSVAGWLQSWFNFTPNKGILTLVGAAILCIPFIKYKYYRSLRFRMLALCSILIWIVIFNHKAESPTFIISMMGVSIWFMMSWQTMIDKTLLVLAIVFTSLSVTDLFPAIIRTDFMVPFVIKVVPCILIWIRIVQMQFQFSESNLD
ncbi:MAG: DUF2029 domain-containing protein [Bacteroidetes bacterium]|nr:DUF2029 domain-containing protein [Bacteroidota bacterium]